jgi:hypothetical protein
MTMGSDITAHRMSIGMFYARAYFISNTSSIEEKYRELIILLAGVWVDVVTKY